MKFPYPDWDLAPTQGQHPFALWCVTRTFSQNLSNASLALYDISNRTMPSLLRESPLPIRRDRNTNQWPWASKQSPLALGLNDSINPSTRVQPLVLHDVGAKKVFAQISQLS